LISRYSCGASSATASWTIIIPKTGTCHIFAFIIVHDNSDPNARYDLYENEVLAQARVVVNQATGVDRWQNILQTPTGITINAGEKYTVTISGSNSVSGCVRADNVKLVRVA
jgi:hypothetical protein